MDFDPELLQELHQIFKAELAEKQQEMIDGLLAFESQPTPEERKKIFESIFRAAHNIKGAARGVDLLDISDIAHHLETFFGVYRRIDIDISTKAIDLSFEALDCMTQCMQANTEGSSVELDLKSLYHRLKNFDFSISMPESDKKNKDHQQNSSNSQETMVEIPLTLDRDNSIGIEQISTAEVNQKITPTVVKKTKTKQENHETIQVPIDKLEWVSSMIEELQVTKIELANFYTNIQQIHQQVVHFSKHWKPLLQEFSSSHHHKLIHNNTSELMNIENEISHFETDIRRTSSQFGILNNLLQDQVRMLRLVPATTFLKPLARTVREISRSLKKKIKMETLGHEIYMDRAIIEHLRDPLMHIIRNAIDHGIESPEQRLQQNKSAEGHIGISICSIGSQILIEIKDDGYGIDCQQIKEYAIKKKIVNQDDLLEMTESDILQLIFRPGLSTKQIITDISGRGVGLDVVKSNLRSIKGDIKIKTALGQGTTFSIWVPLTLATDRGLLIRSGGQPFVIPTTSIDRMTEITTDEIIALEASFAMLDNQQPIPIRSLAETLGLKTRYDRHQDKLQIVIVSKGWSKVAFIVEEIVAEQEIVIKPFTSPLIGVPNIKGGALVGGGEINIVLNVHELMDSSLKTNTFIKNLPDKKQHQKKQYLGHILVVDDSVTTRTLERNALRNHGYQVTTAVNGYEGWQAVQQQNFDLVVTDVEMPEMDGFELTQHIRQSKHYSHLPIIIVTSKAEKEFEIKGIEVGADAYIIKSQFESQNLLNIIKQLI